MRNVIRGRGAAVPSFPTFSQRMLLLGRPDSGDGPPPWTPASLPGCVLYLDASTITGLSANAPVASWADGSGTGAPPAVQAVTAAQPSFVPNAIGGSNAVVRFDGADDFLTIASGLVASVAEFTVFAVAAQTGGFGAGDDYQVIVSNAGNGPYGGVYNLGGNNAALGLIYRGGTSASLYFCADDLGSGAPWSTLSTPGLIVCSNSVSAGQAVVTVNGTTLFSTTGFTDLIRSSLWTIGRLYPLADEFLTGDIALLGLCNGALAPADIARLQAYCAGRGLIS